MSLFEVRVKLTGDGSGWIIQPARDAAEAWRLVAILFEVVEVKAIGESDG